MSTIPQDFRLQSYVFDLPEDRIAQWPAQDRADSRLMVLPRAGGGPSIAGFKDILGFLPENCLLVANNSRVVPARLTGKRAGGGKLEFLLLTPLPLLDPQDEGKALFPNWHRAEAEALLRPAKKIVEKEILSFDAEFAVEVLERGPFGHFRVNLLWQGDLLAILKKHGSPPLPPYIKRDRPRTEGGKASAEHARAVDMERYQTVYARRDKAGSAAAPTAGLHFTPEICRALRDSGREWAEITLYVGYGTFSPVRCEDIREHAMHAEYVELPQESAQAIARAKAEGRAVIAVGTTACRALEGASAARNGNDQPQAFAGWVDHFLYPGKPFRVIDGMVTNFHLPGSSLLMLVSALAGRERILTAYQRAMEEEFRFFSYGDAMLIL